VIKYDTHCAGIKKSLSKFDLNALAKEQGWTQREGGKIAPDAFCTAMIGSTCLSTASLRTLAFLSGTLSESSVSKQAFHKRLNPKACGFFEALLAEVVSDKIPGDSGGLDRRFGRIVVQDSTSISLPDHLLESFKGPKNASGERAGLKIHASFDLLSRRFVGFDIRDQRSADQSFALEGVEGLAQGDLLLRDLGYFSIASFRELEANGAHALSRWQPHVELSDPDNLDTIELLPLLRGGKRIDRRVLAGRQERFPMRLIAFPVPKEVAERRRGKLRENMKRKGRSPSRKILELQGWQIYLTTCPRELLPFDDAFELYRQRWAIEILFKGFKSHMRIDCVPPRASESMVRCLIFSSLIRVAMACVVTLPLLFEVERTSEVSMLKVFSLIEALGFEPGESYFKDAANLENFTRHSLYEKRKRKSLPHCLCSLG